MKEFCKEKLSEFVPSNGKRSVLFDEHCALAHSNYLVDQAVPPHRIYYDYEDQSASVMIEMCLKYTCYLI